MKRNDWVGVLTETHDTKQMLPHTTTLIRMRVWLIKSVFTLNLGGAMLTNT